MYLHPTIDECSGRGNRSLLLMGTDEGAKAARPQEQLRPLDR